MKKRPIAVGVLFVLLCSFAAGERVTPSDRVTSHVVVRAGPSSATAEVGRLRPGESTEFVRPVPLWYEVRLSDGTPGFVSKAWTLLIPDELPETSFRVVFLDVGTGDAAIVDVGDREIVIDGGDSIRVLHDYQTRTSIIDGPIELLVVTHADYDHWNGLRRLLGFDGVNTNPPAVLEFWEPGFDRACRPLASYDEFIGNVAAIPGIDLRRPLEATHPPAAASGKPQWITLPRIPGIRIMLLHADATGFSSNGDCSYRINNASIVMMLEVQGFRFLFTGDANGKERSEPSPGTAGHIEEKLLALERKFPGLLKADVLKAPHHGSETASTQAFIDAVDPQFVIISASTKHHLPRDSVVERYRSGLRVVLRTDEDRANDKDHIACVKGVEGDLECNFEDVLQQ